MPILFPYLAQSALSQPSGSGGCCGPADLFSASADAEALAPKSVRSGNVGPHLNDIMSRLLQHSLHGARIEEGPEIAN